MHKKIGIIGGLSPESTVSYYLHITRKYTELYGDYSYPEIIIYSVNLENYHTWRSQNQWGKITDDLVKAANILQNAGADFCLIATNTMHMVFNEVQSQCSLPFIHILEPTISSIKKSGIKKVGLLGTKFTMAEAFYKDELILKGITPIVPTEEQQDIVYQIIVDELVRGIIIQTSKKLYLDIIDDLISSGAEGIILGCTEIPLLITADDCKVPVFDTVVLHADAALVRAVCFD